MLFLIHREYVFSQRPGERHHPLFGVASRMITKNCKESEDNKSHRSRHYRSYAVRGDWRVSLTTAWVKQRTYISHEL
jgi:hypothetical protein